MMKSVVTFVAVASAAANMAHSGLQQMVDAIFEKYLPAQQAASCHWIRINEQCALFNDTMTDIKCCHESCGDSDFKCHFKCPKAKPTSVKELVKLGEAMLCHKSCGKHEVCHQTACSCPFEQKQAACENLAQVVECHQKGGNHSTCELDDDARDLLLHEPWSLVQDVANHVVDHLLPLPPEQQATEEEVRSCHAGCGSKGKACHAACPSGPWGILKDHCEDMNETGACHQSCKAQNLTCPFKRTACHMRCPKSMPSSVEELKILADHMACHMDCGEEEHCHQSCPPPKMWEEKMERCKLYGEMVACHKGCKADRDCHKNCPSLDFRSKTERSLVSPPGSFVKEAVCVLVVNGVIYIAAGSRRRFLL